MIKWAKLVYWAIWGIASLSILVVVFSTFNNLIRRIGADSNQTSVAHHGACGLYGDCEEFTASFDDKLSLQRGVTLYMENCFGCHSLEHARHQRIAEDLRIPKDIYVKNLLPAGTGYADLAKGSLPDNLSGQWFGIVPPDLTLVARARPHEWLYTYLKAFYVSEERPYGYDNLVFKSVAMPNVLERLQGVNRITCGAQELQEGNCHSMQVDAGTGSLTSDEFDQAVYDITNFLVYVSEPYAQERKELGTYVILFLLLLSVLAYLLLREFNKDYK